LYKPAGEMLPLVAEKVTPVARAPVTLALKSRVSPVSRRAVLGVMVTATTSLSLIVTVFCALRPPPLAVMMTFFADSASASSTAETVKVTFLAPGAKRAVVGTVALPRSLDVSVTTSSWSSPKLRSSVAVVVREITSS
jgi:hypothetical protein